MEQSPEVPAGRGRLAGLQESLLVVVVAAVWESPEGVGERVRLGNLEVVEESPPYLEGSRAGVAAPEGKDARARVLHDRLISGASPRSDVERTCTPWRRTFRHGNVIVCIFLLLFFGHARGRALWHGNIVVCVLCVDTMIYSEIY